MKQHFFKNAEMEFEATRLLWYTPSGGADYGEVAAVTEKIKDGSYESWYKEWESFASKLAQRGESFQGKEAQGNAFLRASRYYQGAEFFLPPNDPRKEEVYQQSVDLFYRGLACKNVAFTQHNLSYQKVELRTLFFRTEQPSLGILYICGGFDALLEELYFTNVVSALANGYNVILYEGPGQSSVIRNYQMPFEADWQQVARVVVDFYQAHYRLIGPKIGVGISLGGLLIARGASLDDELFDKIVLYNYFPSMIDSIKKSLPYFLHGFLEKGFPSVLEKICSIYIRQNKFLNWQIEQAKWVFGGTGLNNLLEICQNFNEEIAYRQLTTDCLVFLAKHDNYYDYRHGQTFFSKIPAETKQLILFDKDRFSSDLHCQNGAAYDSNDQMYEWLLS
ncbi:serine aminopeptidase domain-containing protein [uncultured Vagococcus sp.]|uniref:serine aminopeptidase domain-containing protein n=1 Tax=uncultured Vagococcus sp. TaxID=189676 RepID=UPI0028D6F3C6|nr:alpha/beta hydrolase [uncultured Vagococcus sp.]